MALRHKHLHAYSNLPAIPRGRLITGIIAGVLFAICFYAFLYVCREALRILFFMTENYDVLVLSDSTVSFLNFIFAYIATILGQSLCFTYWFEAPLRRLGKHAPRMRTIVNDQRSMNTYFLSWFSRLVYVFVLGIGSTMGGGIYMIQTFSGYQYVFIPIVIMLFCHSWMNIRRLFNGKSFRWMLVSAVLLSVLSLGLSRINLIDYESINRIILSKNIYYAYRLQLPEAVYTERMNSEARRNVSLWIAEDKNNPADGKPLLFIDHWGRTGTDKREQISLDSLKKCIACWNQNIMEEMLYEPCVIYAHRDIKMSYINKVKKSLAELGVNRIQYAVMPPIREYDDRYYTHLAFPLYTGRYFADTDIWQDLQEELNSAKHVSELHVLENGEILFDDIKIEWNDFGDFIRQLILSTPDYHIKYYISDNSSYADYIFIVSNIVQAISQIRNDYSRVTYQQEYEYLEWEEAGTVRGKYPYRVVEIPTENLALRAKLIMNFEL
ncbi:hypothetical protein [Bacteroides sp. UBA939]|uniref:hypothetical protein n=1 Tax=Bacteroides sp. UBA939 TaxID=1946092 RepID=UPI0025C02C4C|nr:hypothetical protein [Bacteroides sp. UBA939]